MCHRFDRHRLNHVVLAADRRLARSFLLTALLLGVGVVTPAQTRLQYQSVFLRVEVAPDQPALVALAVDSLGKNKLSVNPLRPPAKAERAYELRRAGRQVRVPLLGRTT